ncbi:MAG TPA: DUF45 domain-containing protein [Steroidobacteraceae bacterium]|nr:DUF45 domain-containing protein [Steroidobacteraceae bacterium]HRX90394.1 DUF45 domain-containing protein [Steroidobacteraceae bacterium]
MSQSDMWPLGVVLHAPAAAEISVRTSARARRLGMRVSRAGLIEVVVPRRTPRALVEQFIVQHRDWALQKRALALASTPLPEVFPPPAVHFGLDDSSWRLHLGGGAGRPTLCERTPGILQISGAADGASIRLQLRRWLLRRARTVLEPRLQAVAAEFSLAHEDLTVRRQRSRWGSCSSRGVISLNACLVFQAPSVVRYLMIHELTHLEHMNHSPRFWRAVEARCADWRALDRQLLDGWRRVPSWVFT